MGSINIFKPLFTAPLIINNFSSEKNSETLGIEPGTAGCEVRMLPLQPPSMVITFNFQFDRLRLGPSSLLLQEHLEEVVHDRQVLHQDDQVPLENNQISVFWVMSKIQKVKIF